MWDLKACTVCLCTTRKLFKLDSGSLKLDYYLVSGLKVKFYIKFRIYWLLLYSFITYRTLMNLNKVPTLFILIFLKIYLSKIFVTFQAKDCKGMPQYLCVECSAYVKRFKAFRDKCKRANFTLKTILKKNKEVCIVENKVITQFLFTFEQSTAHRIIHFYSNVA